MKSEVLLDFRRKNRPSRPSEMMRYKKRMLESEGHELGDDAEIKLFGHVINFSSSENDKATELKSLSSSRASNSNLGEVENVSFVEPGSTQGKGLAFDSKSRKMLRLSEPNANLNGGEGDGGDGEGEVENLVSSCSLDAMATSALPTETTSIAGEDLRSCSGSNSGSEDNLNKSLKRETEVSITTVNGNEKDRKFHSDSLEKVESESPPQILNETPPQLRLKMKKGAVPVQSSMASSRMEKAERDSKDAESKVQVSLFSRPITRSRENSLKTHSARGVSDSLELARNRESYAKGQIREEEDMVVEVVEEAVGSDRMQLDVIEDTPKRSTEPMMPTMVDKLESTLELNLKESKEGDTNLANAKTPEEDNVNKGLEFQVLKKPDHPVPCPRCDSLDTKFCYYNNYNIRQPRHFCKQCQRYWTAGGTLRNVPVGSGRRKNKHSSKGTSEGSPVTPNHSNSNSNSIQGGRSRPPFGNDFRTPLYDRDDQAVGEFMQQPWLTRDDRGHPESRTEMRDGATVIPFGLNPVAVMAAGSLYPHPMAACEKPARREDSDTSLSKHAGSSNKEKNPMDVLPVFNPAPYLPVTPASNGTTTTETATAEKNMIPSSSYFPPPFGAYGFGAAMPEEYKNMVSQFMLPPHPQQFSQSASSSEPSDLTFSSDKVNEWYQMAAGMLPPWTGLSSTGAPTFWTNGMAPFGYLDGSWMYPYVGRWVDPADGPQTSSGGQTPSTSAGQPNQVKVGSAWGSAAWPPLTQWSPAAMSSWAQWAAAAGAWQVMPPWMTPSPNPVADVATVSNSSPRTLGKRPLEDSDSDRRRVSGSPQVWAPKGTRVSDLNGQTDAVWKKISGSQKVDMPKSDLAEKPTVSSKKSGSNLTLKSTHEN